MSDVESVKASGGYSVEMQISDADARAATWLHRGNLAAERGLKDRAEMHYAQAQKWLNRSNELRGNN